MSSTTNKSRKYWGVVPALPASLISLIAKEAEEQGRQGVFAAQVHGAPFPVLAVAAAATETLEVASGIAIACTRSPLETAMTTMDMMWTPWHLPPAKAREFAFLGDSFSGTEMARLGWANYAMPKGDLDDFTEKFARRMGHIDNEMLMYTKRAVNRQYESMGIREGLHSGTEIQALSAQRAAAGEWGRRVREDGLKAALEWRDGPFRDFRGAYDSAPKERPVAGT